MPTIEFLCLLIAQRDRPMITPTSSVGISEHRM